MRARGILRCWHGAAGRRKVECMEENGLMLGIFPEGAYKSHDTPPWSRATALFLYTDGITEAPSPSGEEFGMERFKDFLTAELRAVQRRNSAML